MDQPPEVDPIGAPDMLLAQPQPQSQPPSALLSPGRLFPFIDDQTATASLGIENGVSSSPVLPPDTSRKQARRKAAPYHSAGPRPGVERATTASSASNADGTEEDNSETAASNPRKSRGGGVAQTLTSEPLAEAGQGE